MADIAKLEGIGMGNPRALHPQYVYRALSLITAMHSDVALQLASPALFTMQLWNCYNIIIWRQLGSPSKTSPSGIFNAANSCLCFVEREECP